jgi:hypothetical protein
VSSGEVAQQGWIDLAKRRDLDLRNRTQPDDERLTALADDTDSELPSTFRHAHPPGASSV